MNRLFVAHLRHRPGRVATLVAGVLVAVVSFTLLTSAASTAQLSVKGTIRETFRPAYDILVRPETSFSKLERSEGLVRENYLGGIFGGITVRQWQKVKRIPGVEVAAPIANIGYILPFEFFPIEIDPFLSQADQQIYRLDLSWRAENGLSTYPEEDTFVYYTRRNPFEKRNGIQYEVTNEGRRHAVCSGFVESLLSLGSTLDPFDLSRADGLFCYSEKTPRVRTPSDYRRFAPGVVGVTSESFFPVLIAAIDPGEERKLIDLDDTIVSGRGLAESDKANEIRRPFHGTVVPVIASTRTYVAETLKVEVKRLEIPQGIDLLKRLASPTNTYRWIHRLPGHSVGRMKLSVRPVYEQLVRRYSRDPRTLRANPISYGGYWSSSETRYRALSGGRLQAVETPNPPDVFVSDYYGGGWAPQDNRDTNFRHLESHEMSPDLGAALYVVGRFDPEKLPGFNRLSRVPLETYYPPRVEPGDASARRALGDGPLLPNQNLAGYVAQPPLMLTTIKGMRSFYDGAIFDQGGVTPKDQISVIRVRVAGVTGPDPLSLERIKGVAGAIHNRTGLAVDITAGSSPRPVRVELPRGEFGRPALTLQERWVEKGVAVRFLNAIDEKSAALFGLILLVCSFFLANAAFASVRARRREIGVLRCLGWARGKIFAAIVGELALVGLLAGVVGTVLALLLVELFSLDFPPTRALLAIPLALLLSVLAGLVPAWRATRGEPLDAVLPAVAAGHRVQSVGGIVAMAASNLLRMPYRTVLGSLGLVFGIGSLTVLLALNDAFQGALVGNLLGNYISVQIRGVDFLSVVLVIALGGLSVADVLFLNIKERSAELVTLSTLGWGDHHLRILAAAEGAGMGVLGSLVGIALGVGAAALVRGVAISSIAVAAAIAGTLGIAVALVASIFPMVSVARLPAAAILAEEW